MGWNTTSDTQYLVSCIYRRPSATTEYHEKIVDILEYARMTEHPVISLGDLSFNYIMDKTLSTNPIHYIETAYDMYQLIDQPTRVDDKTSSVLDVILTSHPTLHRKRAVLKYTLSDHYLIYTHMEFENTKESVVDNNTVKFRDMNNFTGDPLHSRALAHSRAPLFTQPCPHCSHSRAPGEQWARLCVFTLQGCVQAARLCRGSPVNFDMESFSNDLISYDILNGSLDDDDISEKRWKLAYTDICDKRAPMKSLRQKERSDPWMTYAIIKLMYERDHVHYKATQSNDSRLWQDYRNLRKKVTCIIKERKNV